MKICLLTFFFYMTAWGAAANSFVDAPNGGQPLRVEPPKTVTTFWRVNNSLPTNQGYLACLCLPEKWKSISPNADFEIPAGGSDLRLVCFFVPQTTRSGTYHVSYVVKNKADPTVADSCSVPVVVLPVKKLEIRLLECPAMAIAGELYSIKYLITNQSNTGDSVRTSMECDEKTASNTGTVFWLNAGEMTTVCYKVATNGNGIKLVRLGTQFSAQLGRDRQTRKTLPNCIEIVPRMTEKANRYHRIPLGITLTQVMQTGGMASSGFQADVYADGTLDEAGQKHLELRLKGPDIYNCSYFALHDEYFASYCSETLKLEAGDRLYFLSQLTENSRYGRGASARYDFGRWRAGAYCMKTRWLIKPEQQLGASIDYAIAGQNRIGINVLQKNVQARSSNIISLISRLQPQENLQLNLEGAVGKTANHNRYACDISLLGRNRLVQYNLDYIYADPFFPGYYRDTQFINIGASMRTIGALRFNINIFRRDENINSDSTRYAAPHASNNDFGLNYKWENGARISLNWIDHFAEDRLPVSTFNYREQKLRLLLGQSYARLQFETALESGSTINNLMNRISPMQRLTTSITYSPGSRQSVRGFVSYANDDQASLLRQRQITAGLSTRWAFGTKAWLSLEYQTNQDMEDCYRTRDMYQFDFSQMLFRSHQIHLRGRRTLNSFSLHDKITAWIVDYRIPMDIPIAKIKNRAIVAGTVFNASTREPVKNLMVQINGLAAVTDRKGHFIFPALKPGHYYLTIDCIRMGLHCIADQKMPMELLLQDNDNRTLALGVSLSTGLQGQILFMPNQHVDKIADIGPDSTKTAQNYFVVGGGADAPEVLDTTKGLADCAVQLTMDDETLWRMTDTDGRFSFEDLRPGHWTCKVYQDNLPENYYMENDTFMVDLLPGMPQAIELKVIPKKRKIHMLNTP